MKRRRLILLGVLLLYVAGLAWGYFRLPWAAIRSLRDYPLIARAPAVSLGDLDVSPAQRWYLEHAVEVAPTPVVPRISADVTWYALVAARVESGHFVGSTGAERRDVLFVCLFGGWVPVYVYNEEMA